jgi:hypothetical protein
LWFGFTSLTALPFNDNPLGNSDHGCIIGLNDSDGYFAVRNNDGTGTAANQSVIGQVPKDTDYHNLQIDWPAQGNIHVQVDQAEIELDSQLPNVDTGLYFNCVQQTTSAAARQLFMKGVWLEVAG